MSQIPYVHTNLDEDAEAVREEFQNFLGSLLMSMSEKREQEELSIMNSRWTLCVVLCQPKTMFSTCENCWICCRGIQYIVNICGGYHISMQKLDSCHWFCTCYLFHCWYSVGILFLQNGTKRAVYRWCLSKKKCDIIFA